VVELGACLPSKKNRTREKRERGKAKKGINFGEGDFLREGCEFWRRNDEKICPENWGLDAKLKTFLTLQSHCVCLYNLTVDSR
jgi:hypothetical protein